MNIPELLAPAGGMEQLQAAVRFGADAVYLGADRFGMRARAANFALEDVAQAVRVAHAAGVRVYVTLNVLMDSNDIAALPHYFEELDAAGVDAFIIGDLGAASLARRYAPRVALHVSTQASVANAEAACVWYDLGASRIVCAREMSLAEIAHMRANTPSDLKIEAFAHGALCMAMSGRCLISSYLTGRSANKGHCTQPCRWSYTLEEEKRPGVHFPVEEDARGTFIMNAKDLNMLAHVQELADAGVDAIKIEGRNKKAFYVATVVNAYRHVLDGADSATWMDELDTVSHRPYSTGFYFGDAEQAPHYDGYEQTCIHVADVLVCEPLEKGLGAAEDTHGRVRVMVGGESDNTSVSPAGLHSNFAVRSGGESVPVASDLASVRGSGETTSALWQVEARCRNRFAEGDEVEVLVPHGDIMRVVVRDLVWLPEPSEDNPHPTPQPVNVANRSCARYRFVAAAPVAPIIAADALTFSAASVVAGDAPPLSVAPVVAADALALSASPALAAEATALSTAPGAGDASVMPAAPIVPGAFLRIRSFRRSARH